MEDKEEKIDFLRMMEELKKDKKYPIPEVIKKAMEKYKGNVQKRKEVLEKLMKEYKPKRHSSWEEIVKRYKKEDK